MDHENGALDEVSGHSRHLRNVLRAARERMGLTQLQVAERISERLRLERVVSSSAVSEWERFGRHPAIDVMAAWARVLGMKLHVDLGADSDTRLSVLLRPETMDLARKIDLLSDEDRALVDQMVSRMTPKSARV